MNKSLPLAMLLAAVCCSAQAQVKIGDNPNSVELNAVLELENGTKGLLIPRMPLENQSNPSPLIAPIPSGMLVYNNGPYLTQGFYYWENSKWNPIISTGNYRNHYKLVKSASDLPAPVNGIITLAPDMSYEINGSISVAYPINLNNAWIYGIDAVNDKLIYTNADASLFIGDKGGNIKSLTLSAPNVGSHVFDIHSDGSVYNLILENLYIKNSDDVGTIEGLGGTVFMETVAYFSNSNGITFSNDTNVILSNMLWDKGNSNTYERFTGNFSFILKTGGAMQVLSENLATGIRVDNLNMIRGGEIKNVMFIGSGEYTSGTFSNRWEVESTGVYTQKDDEAMAHMYMSSTYPNFVGTVSVPTKVAGTTTTSSLFRISSPQSNRLQYNGRKTRYFEVICSLNMTCAGSGRDFSFYFAKNDTVLVESRQLIHLKEDRGPATLSCVVELKPGDYLELWAANNTDYLSYVVETMNMSIR